MDGMFQESKLIAGRELIEVQLQGIVEELVILHRQNDYCV